jgi:integrase
LDRRDKCILVLLFKTGMRVGGLTSLDVADVDLDKGELTLKLNVKRSNRVLFLDNEAIAVLQRWLAARKNRKGAGDKALFISKTGTRIAKKSADKLIEKHAERLGLHNPGTGKLEDRSRLIVAGIGSSLICLGLKCLGISSKLQGDTRGEVIDIYNHIDKKELRESYLAHITQNAVELSKFAKYAKIWRTSWLPSSLLEKGRS